MRRLLSLTALFLLWTGDVTAQEVTGTIVGTVRDEASGGAIDNAEVWLDGTRFHTISRDDGRFLMVGVMPGTYTVRVSRIGFAAGELAVTVVAGETTEVAFDLTVQAINLDAIVATGYGSASRRELTGAVSSISGDDVAVPAAPTLTVSNALQGRAAGVHVLTASGLPGAGASVRVRGTNSITANSEPLYVVDGVPVVQGTASTDPTQNPLVTINPNDIASVEILKDASATAIYGARGANGVILVTTKGGGEDGNVITVESSYGTQQISKDIDVLTARQYRELRNEAMANVGQAPQYTPEEVFDASTTNYPSLLVRDAPQ